MGDHGDGSHLIPLRTNVSDFIKGSPMAPRRAKLFKAHPALLLVLLVMTWQSAGTQEGPDSILPEEALQRLSAGLRASPLGMALEAGPLRAEYAAELGQVAALAENHAAPEEGLTAADEDGRKHSKSKKSKKKKSNKSKKKKKSNKSRKKKKSNKSKKK